MTFLHLFWEFFKIGLFAIGGGPATLPFLMDLTEKYDWYTMSDLSHMVAVAESTPGPLGINMATYAGYHAAGIAGGLVATASLVLPSLIVIIIIAKFMANFSQNKTVKAVFFGIRPAVTALIASAVYGIIKVSLITEAGIAIKPLILCVIVFFAMNIKQCKKWHPALWLLIAAIIGIVFKF